MSAEYALTIEARTPAPYAWNSNVITPVEGIAVPVRWRLELADDGTYSVVTELVRYQPIPIINISDEESGDESEFDDAYDHGSSDEYEPSESDLEEAPGFVDLEEELLREERERQDCVVPDSDIDE